MFRPHPGNFSLQYSLNESTNVTLKIIDILGREVYKSIDTKQIIGVHEQKVNVDLESGIYSVVLIAGNAVVNKKVIVTK